MKRCFRAIHGIHADYCKSTAIPDEDTTSGQKVVQIRGTDEEEIQNGRMILIEYVNVFEDS